MHQKKGEIPSNTYLIHFASTLIPPHIWVIFYAPQNRIFPPPQQKNLHHETTTHDETTPRAVRTNDIDKKSITCSRQKATTREFIGVICGHGGWWLDLEVGGLIHLPLRFKDGTPLKVLIYSIDGGIPGRFHKCFFVFFGGEGHCLVFSSRNIRIYILFGGIFFLKHGILSINILPRAKKIPSIYQ